MNPFKASLVIALPAILSCSPATLISVLLTPRLPAQPTQPPIDRSIFSGGEVGGAFHSYLSVIDNTALSKHRVLLLIRISGTNLGPRGTLGDGGSWTFQVMSTDNNSFWSGDITSSGATIQSITPPPGYEAINQSSIFDNYFISKWQYDSTTIAQAANGSETMTLMSPHEFEMQQKKNSEDPVWAVGPSAYSRYFNARTGAEVL